MIPTRLKVALCSSLIALDVPVLAAKNKRRRCVQGGLAWCGVFDMATIAEQSRQEKAMSRDVPDAPEWQLLG